MDLGSRSYQQLRQPRVTVLYTMVVSTMVVSSCRLPANGWLAMTHGPCTYSWPCSALPGTRETPFNSLL